MGITAQAAKRYPEAYAGDSSGLGFSSEGERNPFCLTAVKRMWMSLMVDAGMATKREQPKERKDKAHKELADEWTWVTPAADPTAAKTRFT
jgi:hypothetical protein